MNLRFWGVRGSIPTPESDRLRYGGNTTCLEIGSPAKKEAVLIDCGSGIRALPGAELMLRPVSRIHILLSHFHWDHIQGLPSFAPLFQSGVEIIFYANRPPIRSEAAWRPDGRAVLPGSLRGDRLQCRFSSNRVREAISGRAASVEAFL
jgi:glyoxylase-like metal-dependent hydrolase (beta-lactamase superfamily II)